MECLVRGAGTADRERAAGHQEPGSAQSWKRDLIRVAQRGCEGAHVRREQGGRQHTQQKQKEGQHGLAVTPPESSGLGLEPGLLME